MQTHWILDHDAVATAAKYAGLAFTMALGVAGTAADTHEKTAAGVRITRVGWIVMILIVTSSIVGAAGQYYEDQAKQAATTAQLAKLERITDITERARGRFSGHLTALIDVNIPIDQEVIREPISRYEKRFAGLSGVDKDAVMSRKVPIDAGIDAIANKLKNVAFFIDIFDPADPQRVLLEANRLSPATVADVDIQSIDRVKRTMTVVFNVRAAHIANINMFNVADFGNRQLFLRYYPSVHDFFDRTPPIKINPVGVELYDSELNTELTETYLAAQTMADDNVPVFSGLTRQLFKVPAK